MPTSTWQPKVPKQWLLGPEVLRETMIRVAALLVCLCLVPPRLRKVALPSSRTVVMVVRWNWMSYHLAAYL